MRIPKSGCHFIVAAMLSGLGSQALAQGEGQLITPDSSTYTADNPYRVRTFFKIFRPVEGLAALNAGFAAHPQSIGAPPVPGLAFATPASMACIYGLVSATDKCNPNSLTSASNPTGGGKAIAIVDAYHYPHALSDLNTFSTQFGLPAPNLTVVYASGSKPPNSPNNWEVEEALDLQWAHAVAPNAQLYLVEAASNSTADLLAAVQTASSYITAAGGGEVSMSWGGAEFSTESNYDTYFQTANVVYFAASGDSAGIGWPCVSPYVVCVGGTTLRQSPKGNFLQEVAWIDGGGGLSKYYGKPAYQSSVSAITSDKRGVPDVALAADPVSGGWVSYTPSNTGVQQWWIVGGTSWSSPTFAGIVNSAGSFLRSSSEELTTIYSNLGTTTNFNDISHGWCNFYASSKAMSGWDICTGVGSNFGQSGK